MLKIISKENLATFIVENEIALIPTHAKLSLPIINRMYRKMSAGIRFPAIKVEGRLICDGHHRYLASLLAKFPLERIPGMITSATSGVQWTSVCFEETDWDTSEEINFLNAQDAEYNNIDIAELAVLLQ
ncbi:MAG TPA: hypothetical protein DHW64_11730 [Chitinophagaceae bacterium]|nr:hypothetical protein [Chitinophagaceae bacterium]